MADVDHLNELPDFCRVCGRYCRRKNIDMYSVKEYLTELKIIFSINAEMDRPSLHPPKFCHQCYCTLKRALVAEGDYNHEVTLFKWESHTNSSDCMVRDDRSTSATCIYYAFNISHTHVLLL